MANTKLAYKSIIMPYFFICGDLWFLGLIRSIKVVDKLLISKKNGG